MLIFTYGTLKRGHGNNHYMRGCRFVGDAVSTEAAYSMNGRGFPFLYQGNQYVLGEVWEVPEEAVPAIDRLEGHPEWYRREERTFIVDGKEVKTLTAWVYMQEGECEGGYKGRTVYWPQLVGGQS